MMFFFYIMGSSIFIGSVSDYLDLKKLLFFFWTSLGAKSYLLYEEYLWASGSVDLLCSREVSY